MACPGYRDLIQGAEIAPRQYPVTRLDLVRYAGASGDFNPIHWNERIATSVGLPDVIAHGMLTMALAGRFLTEWAGDPAAVTEFGVGDPDFPEDFLGQLIYPLRTSKVAQAQRAQGTAAPTPKRPRRKAA